MAVKVLTYGVFDLLHLGHIKSLKLAKKFGKLTVGVFSDEVAESFKRKPIIPQDQRMALLKELRCVDHVFLLEKKIPDFDDYDFVVKGPGAGFEELTSDKMLLLPYHTDNSTTKIIEKIQCMDKS